MSTLFDDEVQSRLTYAREMRMNLLDKVVGDELPNGDELPRAQFISSLLRDMEKVELDIAKIRVGNATAAANQANANIMLELMRNAHKLRPKVVHASQLVLPETIEAELLDGEDELEYTPIGYDELVGGE